MGSGFEGTALTFAHPFHYYQTREEWPLRALPKAKSIVQLISFYPGFGCPPDLESRYAWT